MKLKDISIEDLKNKLNERRNKIQSEYEWLHKDKRYISLLNEYERRILNLK